MRPVVVVVVFAAVGCHATIGDQPGGPHDQGVDGGRNGSDAVDAAPMIDAAPACANGRRIYLNFEGVTLHRGASDATLDQASWVGKSNANVTSGTVPRYHAGSTTRDTDIASIVSQVRAYVANDPISVVTERPAAGPYVMVTFGGAHAALGVPYPIAVNDLDCGDTAKSDVAWVSDSTPLDKVASFTIGAVGYGLGLTATEKTSDCMCGWDNDCAQDDGPCVLSPMVASDNRCGKTTQDEVAAFATAFCE